VTPSQEAFPKSPWTTVWLSPRRAIDDILATPPRHLVWLLAIFATIASFCSQLLIYGLASLLLDWRILLGLVLTGVIVGIAWLYLAALVFSWIGKSVGGRASPLQLRSVLAWSTMPSILGFIFILALLAASQLSGDANSSTARILRLLSLGIFVCCGVWSFVVLLLMLSRAEQFGFWRALAVYVLGGLLLPAAVAVLFRTFLFQPFNLPSHSMSPTLLDGDYMFVSKYAYGYTHYSLPLSPPLFPGRIFGSEPARGDVVTFRLPRDTSADYIKRIVGLPGDRIQMREGQLYINDMPVARERLADFIGGDSCGSAPATPVKRWRETLPNGASYETLDCVENGFYDNTAVYTVPAGHFFLLGDNRDNSTDSRVLSVMGYVPFENLIGRVGLIFYSRESIPGGITKNRSERFGMMVH